ncbi:MAG: transcriptional regulator [Brevundimonas sp.]|jgi:quercetin dioxygenase-like cupin family protein|uniref:transcriptional regulator n=1 Tax=Brevundimonas sp. TaxID=1871086 RepID=UPI001799FD96|nr:transcriptional regulator [Brevundimonas sp.]MBA4805777.1 transcriptional regulator [Brevundimonas sp.]
MTDRLIPDLDAGQRAAFGRTPMTYAHRLLDTGLFGDEALAAQLERHPAELFDINIFHYDADDQALLQTGTKGDRPGAALLEAVKAGRVWIQMRRIQDHWPELGAAMRRVFAELSDQVPGFRPVQVTGQLILSAPQAKVPFHADPPGVTLFHLRGEKRIWIYPVDEAHMPARSMENIVLEQQTEDLPYRREMDAAAEVFDLKPGLAAAWPLHAPHRIENLGSFNVSLSCDYQTWTSRITNGAHYANGVLRRWGAPVLPADRAPMAARTALWGASMALRRMGVVRTRLESYERAFELGDAPPPPDKGLIAPLAMR